MNFWTIGILDRYNDSIMLFSTKEDAIEYFAMVMVADFISEITGNQSNEPNEINAAIELTKLLQKKDYIKAIEFYTNLVGEDPLQFLKERKVVNLSVWRNNYIDLDSALVELERLDKEA